MWFSTQLRNKVSDDIIDLLTGHTTRYAGAYLGDAEKTLVEIESQITESLRLQHIINSNGIRKELSKHETTITALIDELNTMRKTYEERIKNLETELSAKEVSPEQEAEAEEVYEKQIEQRANQLLQPLIEQIQALNKKVAELEKKP